MDDSVLASALVERLAAVLPSAIAVVAIGREIEISAQGRDGRVVMDVSAFGPLPGIDGYEEEAALRNACLHVLDTVQDYVAEATAEPWPGERVMPEPVVEVSSNAISLAYVRNGAVILGFPDISR